MTNGIDNRVLQQLSYGLYITTSKDGERLNGQLVNTVIQVTPEPVRIAVIISKKNLTHEFIDRSGVFAACVLDEGVTMKFLGPFGFRSGREVNKFAAVNYKLGITGCPIVLDNTLSFVEAKVLNQVDLGSHTVFVGDVVNTEIIREGVPLTYRYYYEHLRGKTPPNAPSYRPN